MTSIVVVRDVFDALGRLTVSTPMFIDDSQLATYQLYGWRTVFGAPVAPLEPDQIPEIIMSPTDLRPWELDWAAWLGGASILTSLWLPSPAGLTLSGESASASTTKAWFGPGTSGTYLVTNRITSSDGRGDDKSVTVVVKQR